MFMTQMRQVFCPAALRNAAHQMALEMIRLPELFSQTAYTPYKENLAKIRPKSK